MTNAAVSTPILIVGGGPSGLAAAAELSWHGVECMLVEPRLEVAFDRPRAKTTSVRTMEHLRRWGVADELRNVAPLPVAWSDRVVFCTSLHGEQVTEFRGAFGLTASRHPDFAEAGQQVPQPLVERLLRAHLSKSSQVRLALGHRVVDVIEREGDVRATVEDAEGSRYVVEAQYLLGCDGPNSTVRQAIGVAYQGTSDPRPNFNVVFRAPGLHSPLGNAVQYWVVGGRTPGLLGRLDPADETWWAIAPGVPQERGLAETDRIIGDLVGAEVEHDVLSTDPWTARMLVAERFQTNRVFLVGESAHLNPPWGGHGYNTSVGDAVNIGWKLAAALRGWAGPALLSSYEPERRSVVEQTVRSAVQNMSTLSTDLVGTPGGRTALAEVIQRTKKAEFHSLGLVLGYDYGGSPVVQPSPPVEPSQDLTTYVPTREPGHRLPHAWLPDGSSLYDHLGRGLTLVGRLARDPDGVEALAQEARSRRIPLQLVDAPQDDAWADDYLLVRPDQHIAWRTRTLDDINIDLDRVTGHR